MRVMKGLIKLLSLPICPFAYQRSTISTSARKRTPGGKAKDFSKCCKIDNNFFELNVPRLLSDAQNNSPNLKRNIEIFGIRTLDMIKNGQEQFSLLMENLKKDMHREKVSLRNRLRIAQLEKDISLMELSGLMAEVLKYRGTFHMKGLYEAAQYKLEGLEGFPEGIEQKSFWLRVLQSKNQVVLKFAKCLKNKLSTELDGELTHDSLAQLLTDVYKRLAEEHHERMQHFQESNVAIDIVENIIGSKGMEVLVCMAEFLPVRYERHYAAKTGIDMKVGGNSAVGGGASAGGGGASAGGALAADSAAL